MSDVLATGTTLAPGSVGFVADDGERHERWKTARIGFAVAASLLVPGLMSALAVLPLVLFGSPRAEEALLLACALLNPLAAVLPAAIAAEAWARLHRRTTRVALDVAHVSIPAHGADGFFATGLSDGYRYVAHKEALVIRVPYGRIHDVRRVHDPAEQARLTEPDSVFPRFKHASTGSIVVRGYVLQGDGAEADAPTLFEEALRTSHVTDPASAVAITFGVLHRDGPLYPHLPASPEGATLYVSVADPDALLLELSTRVAAAGPAELPKASLPMFEIAMPPAPFVLAPALVQLQGSVNSLAQWLKTPPGTRVMDLGTGLVWWVAVSLLGLVLTEGGVTLTTVAVAGASLARDAGIFILFVAVVTAAACFLGWSLLLGLVEFCAILVGFRPLWRRIVLTVLLLTASPTITYLAFTTLSNGMGPRVSVPASDP